MVKEVILMYVILVYDINGDEGGGKVLNRVFKICKKYLTHVQKSVFEGEISEVKLKQLRKELEQYIRKELDSIIVFSTNNNKWLKKEMWALKEDKLDNFI